MLSERNRWLVALVRSGVSPAMLAIADMGHVGHTLEGARVLSLPSGEDIPLSPEVLEALRRWRGHLGLPPECSQDERHPLIQVSRRDPSRLRRREIERIIRRLRLEKPEPA